MMARCTWVELAGRKVAYLFVFGDDTGLMYNIRRDTGDKRSDNRFDDTRTCNISFFAA